MKKDCREMFVAGISTPFPPSFNMLQVFLKDGFQKRISYSRVPFSSSMLNFGRVIQDGRNKRWQFVSFLYHPEIHDMTCQERIVAVGRAGD